jgi:hypothetical protein
MTIRLNEVSPPGWSGTVKAMKKHMPAGRAFALAWSMHKKGAEPHYKSEKSTKSKGKPVLKKKYQEGLAGQLAGALEEGSKEGKEFKVGDIVRYTGKFLRNIGMQAGAPINGKVVGFIKMGGGKQFPKVLWSDRDEPVGVAPANIEHDPKFKRKGLKQKPIYFESMESLSEDIYMGAKASPKDIARYKKMSALAQKRERERLLDEIDAWESGAKATMGQPASGQNYSRVMVQKRKELLALLKALDTAMGSVKEGTDINASFEAVLDESVSLPAEVVAISNYVASKEGNVSEIDLVRKFRMTADWAKKILAVAKRAFRGAGIPRSEMKRARANPARYFRELVLPILEKLPPPQSMAAAAESVNELFLDAIEEELLTEKGHHYYDGKNYYADTAFLNAIGDTMKGMQLKHMGFGEFSLEGDGKTIEFDRMRGKDFKGQSGRSHQVYDNQKGALVKELIKQMEKKGKSELVKEETELDEAQSSDALDLCRKVTEGLPQLKKKHFFCRFGPQYVTPQVIIEYADVPKGAKNPDIVHNPKQVKFRIEPFKQSGDAEGDVKVEVHYSNDKSLGFKPMKGSVSEVASHIIKFLKQHDAKESKKLAASLAAQLDSALYEEPVVEDWYDLSVLSWTDADLEYVLNELEEAALGKVGKAAVIAALLLGLGEAVLSREINPSNYRQGIQTVLTVADRKQTKKPISDLLKKYGVMEDGGLTERKEDFSPAPAVSTGNGGSPPTAATGELTSDNQELKRELERSVEQTRRFVRSVYHLEEAAAELVQAAKETERIRREVGVERAMQRTPLGNATRSFEAEVNKLYGSFAEGRNAMMRLAKLAKIPTRRTGKMQKPSVPTGEITATSLVRDVLQVTSKLAGTIKEAAELGSVAIREGEKLLNQKSVIAGEKLQDRLAAYVQVYLDFRDQVSAGLFKMVAAVVRRMNEMTRRLMKMWESIDHGLHIIVPLWVSDPDFEKLWEDEDIVISGEGVYPLPIGWLEAVA